LQAGRQWDEATLFGDVGAQGKPMVMSALRRFYDWGRGRLKGSFHLRLKGTGTRPFTSNVTAEGWRRCGSWGRLE
jgi:hypothetical protein